MTKINLTNIAAQIIKDAYKNKGKLLKNDVDIFYSIDQSTRLKAQKYVNLGLI